MISRRTLLTSGAAAGTTLITAKAQATAQSSQENSAKRKIKVIVCGGHPGDPEYGCGGTIARLSAMGHDVALLYLNDGGWPPTPSTIRIAEARKACEILKAKPLYAGQTNGHAIVDAEHYQQFAKMLEEQKPDAVFTQWFIDNHADHRAITTLTYNAWNLMKRRFALYYYEVSNGEDTLQFSPNRYVDITEQESQKKAACYAHATQTPDRYYALQDDVARFRGIESGSKRAEAFLAQTQSPYDIFPLSDSYGLR